jgi:hypothetical protein
MDLQAQPGALSFVRVANFGGWLRLAVAVPHGTAIQVVATLALKG